jgi:hypothetical protein
MISNTKIVQSYIQGLVQIAKQLRQLDQQADLLKSKFDGKSVDLTGTNITSAQLTAVNTFLNNLSSLSDSAVVVANPCGTLIPLEDN